MLADYLPRKFRLAFRLTLPYNKPHLSGRIPILIECHRRAGEVVRIVTPSRRMTRPEPAALSPALRASVAWITLSFLRLSAISAPGEINPAHDQYARHNRVLHPLCLIYWSSHVRTSVDPGRQGAPYSLDRAVAPCYPQPTIICRMRLIFVARDSAKTCTPPFELPAAHLERRYRASATYNSPTVRGE